MAYVITSPCEGTCDTSCVDVCPADCIVGVVPIDEIRAVPSQDRAKRFPTMQLFIDPDECLDCHACVPECPVDAIFAGTSVPEEHRADIKRNADFFSQPRVILQKP